MPAYYYIALNHTGRQHKGVLEAESEKHARQLLRDKALFPMQIRPYVSKKKSADGLFTKISRIFFRNHLTTKELALFTRQFATLLTAALPIEEALSALAEQTEKSRVKSLILSIRSKIVEGYQLASALSEHPQNFSPLFCATVTAGEKSGYLDKVLLRLADYTEQQWSMRRKLSTALIYPIMIVMVAVAIVGFLLEYVVPKMIGVYSHINQTLPLLTTILISISDVVKNDGWYVLGMICLMTYFVRRLLKNNTEFRQKVHAFLLKLPIVGYLVKTVNTARFARTFAILSASGVSILEAMRISAQLITAIPIRKAVETAVNQVREGKPIYATLKQTTFFSPMSVHMIASGETSGQLEDMLERVAQYQEEEVSRIIELGLALFEPAVILIMGVIVLFIVLAVLLPIFELNQFAG